MDPESAAFQPRDDFWRIQGEMLRVQQTQADLSDRVSRLERRHEDDSRLKNVWGTSSPFPSVLGGTPQQVPLQQPTAEHFSNFDHHTSNLIGNLQLDAEDEPRRIGTTSRANSVRFDETADYGRWAHASRPSLDLIARTGSGMGGHAMSERSYSHKSVGGQSSAGHSVHSATSGRANSLTGYGAEPPGLAPGLFILGSVPAIIRCWLTTTFKHDTMLYAAVCSGSYASYLDLQLIRRLGYEDVISKSGDHTRKIKLPVYLPEAIPVSASSRSSSPAPQLPSLIVEFTVVENEQEDDKAIQIFLGSDMMRAHNADILFSSNQLTLYDDDRSKLRIPLVRPEDEHVFKSLYITSSPHSSTQPRTGAAKSTPLSPKAAAYEDEDSISNGQRSSTMAAKSNGAGTTSSSDDDSMGRRSLEQRPHISLSTTRSASKEPQDSPASATPRSGPSPAIWNNWRRDAEKSSSGDWAKVGKPPASTYQRRDTGIKVLKKPGTRTLSTSISSSSSPAGQSRFFDDGKRRNSNASEAEGTTPMLKRSPSGEKAKENGASLGRMPSANPVGGASAFAWLNTRSVKYWLQGSSSGGRRLLLQPCPRHAKPYGSLNLHAPADCRHTYSTDAGLSTEEHLPQRSNDTPPWSCIGSDGRLTSVTTASAKKRKIAPTAPSDETRPEQDHSAVTHSHPPNEGTAFLRSSPRSSPLPSATTTQARNSASPPPRYLPPHMHDEIFEAAAHEAQSTPREPITGASSPSEAYAQLTLDGEPMAHGSDPKPHPRAASPAKRLHSDMADGNMDVDEPSPTRRNSGQSSPRPPKPLPTPQRSLRATSIEMADATSNGGSDSASASASASIGESAATSVSTPASELPPLEEQVNKVLALTNKPLQDRQVGYIVSQSWLERVWARTPQYANKQPEFAKSASEGDIGPVDNSSLLDRAALAEDLADQQGEDFIPMRSGLQFEQDFEVLPAEAWELIISWYGMKEGSPVIRRYAHETSPDQYTSNVQYELNPPIFTIRKVKKSAPSTLEASKKLVASRSDNLIDFINAAKRAAGIHVENKVRVWRIINAPAATDPPPSQQPSGMLTPEASPPPAFPPPPPATLPLVIDAASLTNLDIGSQREEVTGKDEAANEAFNDKLNLSAAGLAEDQVLVLEEQDENGEYVTGALSKVTSKNGVLANKKGTKSTATSGRSTPAPSGPMTRGRTRNGRVRGTTGLTNLGNTCYMNSALQCVRSVEELAIYFLSNKYKKEINTDNPLGHHGNIARAYAGLMASIYDENGVSSFAPKNFKNTLGRAQPIFSGYGQQDSQEFLSFLVDGLHEDLNRIHKKPYTEYPESDDNTHRDPEAIKALGEKFRAIHHARNDSVAMDLFNGFYKNTMVCPDCEKVSITFDPYSLVTLQLPIEQTWQHTVRFVPLRGKIWDVEVDIDKNATIKALKDYVGKRFGVDGSRIMASEVYSHKYYKHFEDKTSIAECSIQQRDDVYFYELDDAPSNWPPKSKKKKSSYYSSFGQDADEEIPDSANSVHDKIVVPLFHRAPINSSTHRAANWTLKLWPSYILLDREEAKDYDTILKKVLGKVAQMTTRDIFANDHDSSLAQSRSSSDVVLTTEDDASPNGDPRVQDGSVEGEDNMVEVTMADTAETHANSSHAATVPEILRPGSFIPPDFRQLFEMKHTRAGTDWIPTGWSSIDGNKPYENISKRIRKPSTRGSSMQSLDDASNAESSDEDDAPQFSADQESLVDAANQSSDEDEIMQPSIEPTSFSRNGRQRKKSKKLSKMERKHMNNKNRRGNKKGKANHFEQTSQSYEEPEDEDDGRLIKLGEGIVLDWSVDAFDALFDGLDANDSRGMDALKLVETVEDEELQRKKEKRKARKKNGITLDECFAETSKREVLSEDNAWYCNRCKELRRATKTLEIWTAPDILVVHLKRFSSQRAFRDKVDALVDFPVQGLDLTGKVGLPEDKDLVYDLFAVDNHYGGLGGGHYTAYAKNMFDQQWYEYNDSSVTKCSNPERVVTTAAYLLFYRRRSAGPLGPPALQEIVNAWQDPEYEGEGGNDEANSRNPSPSGNGLHLGDSSRNGSSSAFGTGAGALRGGGSGGAGSQALNGAGVENPDNNDDSLPAYGDEDEGYGEESDLNHIYAPLGHMDQQWSFASIPQNTNETDVFTADDDYASNAAAASPIEGRMNDFPEDDDLSGVVPGQSTPLGQDEDEIPLLEHSENEVVEIRVGEKED
ncbi:UCH-domain-containing protein [Massarina eburnea CBS 473.64]|uniref:ubiquitinyl hydrolase 1 n=1 Tax=Massarina eburnea CBS 473.64 TaxID=1395130 RepID=A0A6A6RIE7_9PLEO|nr:UCH-domain-containing protein [Massarina eburnea CBS 473.64]